jgi:hypothetical protein
VGARRAPQSVPCAVSRKEALIVFFMVATDSVRFAFESARD